MADHRGVITATHPVLADAAAMSERQLYRAIRHLVEAGALEVARRAQSEGRYTAKSYRLTCRSGDPELHAPACVLSQDPSGDVTPTLGLVI